MHRMRGTSASVLIRPVDEQMTVSTTPERVIAITGAARGIGAATAAAAVRAGYAGALLDRDQEAVERHAQALRAAGGECLAIVCNVADESEVQAAFGQIRARYGFLSALVTSAGIDRGGPVHELDARTWDAVLAVNLRGTFLSCREAVRLLLDRGGAIVCISSPFALVSAHRVAAYASSKAAVCALVRSLAIDYASSGIRVNALLPGPTDTELMWANVPEHDRVSTRATVCRE